MVGKEERFLQAAETGEVAEVRRLLAEDPTLVRARTQGSEEIALHLAASFGHLDVVGMLVEAGADVNAEDCYHHTPTTSARQAGHHPIADWLRERGGEEYA